VPQILRRIITGLMLASIFMAVSPPLTSASPYRTQHVQVKLASHTTKNNKRPDKLCQQASAVRKKVIKHFTKLYTAQYTAQYGKKKGKKKGTEKARDLPGRDICRYGLRGGKKPSRSRKLHYRQTLQRMLEPPPPPVTTTTPVIQVPASPTPSTTSTSSGGSGGSTYCGLFQFDQKTWESVGGTGSPCAASPTEQWSRAEQLHQQRGNQAWPVCGANGESLSQIAQCESSGNPQARG